MAPISNDWLEPLKPEFRKPYYAKLYKTVMDEYHTKRIYPPADDIFNAFALTPLKDVKVVILGQDPYHGDGQAHGLCFSVKPEVEIPPSLVNIYKELHDDCGCYIPDNGYLTKWAKQGVFVAEHGSDRACTSGKFPQGDWMGRIYRCGNPHPGSAGSSNGISAVGQTGSDEKIHAAQKSEASDPGSTASKSAFRISRIFWSQTFQPDK